MYPVEVTKLTKDEQAVLTAMRADATLKGAVVAMVAAAHSGELTAKSTANLEAAAATLPEPKPVTTMTIEQMKRDLRARDCLYDNPEIWKKLGALEVPELPEAVIRKAYEKGGRVILRCSSMASKANSLTDVGHRVSFRGYAEKCHYEESVPHPEWIVVQSHIDTQTLRSPKSEVVTARSPAPTPEDWFAAIAYARMDGDRQPDGCQGLWAFTIECGTAVGSNDEGVIIVYRSNQFSRRELGAARFGRLEIAIPAP